MLIPSTWDTIAAHDYDEVRVRSIASAASAGMPLKTQADRVALRDAVNAALVSGLGSWVLGWTSAANDGGFVTAYCCPNHTFKPGTNVVEVVTAAVDEWHHVIVELDSLFREVRLSTAGLEEGEIVRQAASALLPWVLDKTQANDSWYRSFQDVLCWYLGAAVNEYAEEQISLLLEGRFESWVEPSEKTSNEVFDELSRIALQREPSDALEAWLKHRPSRIGLLGRSHVPPPVQQDAHTLYIEKHDASRSPARASRMKRALFLARKDAKAGRELTFERLCAWQRVVLDVKGVGFREGEAYAHGGRQRYGLKPGTPKQFRHALAEASASTDDPVTRAARVYLDICFFHPFDDGNARAARLALDYVLTRASLALHTTEPVFLVAKSGLDRQHPWAFRNIIDQLAGKKAF